MLKNMITNETFLDKCCFSVDYAKEDMRRIYDYTDKAGPIFSGSFDIYNKKKQMVETIYIKEVIYNNPVTVVFWSDGTKTISKCGKGDSYNEETGLLYCIIKKLSTNSLDKLFEEWIPTQKQLVKGPIHVTLKDIRKNSK
ncbi:MAG: hypothetical protein J6R47_05015 [Acholeplasmatales bacterium]|nr:hypothetical protein [Acholeplasmatales bacterium]